jgi:hypothetical protein
MNRYELVLETSEHGYSGARCQTDKGVLKNKTKPMGRAVDWGFPIAVSVHLIQKLVSNFEILESLGT